MKYSLAQSKAISHVDGPMLVVAGPGSGKTAVITRRIKYLIESAGVHPAEILVITFTRAAAAEMKARFLSMSEGKDYPVRFSTFHALFYWIIRKAYRLPSDVVISEQDKQNMSEEELKDLGKIDFDDMVIKCRELLTERPDILERVRNMYRYILVDEFQDSSPMQYEILKLLAHPADNLFCVGDDDQSVYGFRGASPEIMRRMKREFRGTKLVKLTKNYRCDRLITKASATVIAENKKRFKKKLVSASGKKGVVRIYELPDDSVQTEYLIREIQSAKRMGIPYEEQAVIFRINAEGERLTYRLKKCGIPYAIHAGAEDTELKETVLTGGVRLMTMHGAKGLEFDRVYIIDAVEGFTPYIKAKTAQEREEERRMFYVAMTRARHSLMIFAPQKISGREYEKSRYLKRLL